MKILESKIREETISGLLQEFERKVYHDDKKDLQFWYARDLQKLLGYNKWINFKNVIDKAQTSCKKLNQDINLHWQLCTRELISEKGKVQRLEDYKLTRYACYLIAQNGDPRKQPIAFAQTYFAAQTRRRELQDLLKKKSLEDDKRVKLRNAIKDHNKSLSGVAKKYGVREPKDYGIFQNAGYRGLYDGKTAKDIAKRKKLDEKSQILDHMGSEELAANWFRVTQTEAQLIKDNRYKKEQANTTHFNVGKKVRNAMVNKPENLPTPDKSVKQLEKESKARYSKLTKSNRIIEK